MQHKLEVQCWSQQVNHISSRDFSKQINRVFEAATTSSLILLVPNLVTELSWISGRSLQKCIYLLEDLERSHYILIEIWRTSLKLTFLNFFFEETSRFQMKICLRSSFLKIQPSAHELHQSLSNKCFDPHTFQKIQ